MAACDFVCRSPAIARLALFLVALMSCITLLAHSQDAWLDQAPESDLPEGPGKAIIEEACVMCHALSLVSSAGYDRAQWLEAVDRMVTLGAELTPDQVPVVVDYLAANFPDRSTQAVVVAGAVEVSIKEWTVPTPGSRPHDPLVAPDGMIWYTGQRANVMGRFDPKTEQFKEYPLPIKDSGPHGLAADKDGNIWFTANSAAYVGKLDPKTGEVKEYKMPDPKAGDPHTPIFDQRGILYFTLQRANMIGRINPKTDEIKLITLPTPRSNPYGMVVGSDNTIYLCEFGGNRLAKIDPDTMELTEYTLPNPATRPRRIAITPDDVLWYSDYARGYLGRFDPKTGKHTEWTSPGGFGSQPYGITAIGDIIWYSESGVEPNTMVRFDPATEKFQTWPIPSGGGVVRNVSPTPDGSEIWLATSGVNGIARVSIKQP
ncbi:MAG: cytochrome C [Acidobacteria bacterium]|nr:cytochrome C [Acidobacteriota bacterium]